TARNVPRLAPEDTDGDDEISDAEQAAFDDMLAGLVANDPQLQEVKQIVDDALAAAAEIGNKPVGVITDDITTAYTDSDADGELTKADTRDDRSSESTLGDLVGNALRDTLASDDLGGAEIGITNPGGLRSELFFAGDTPDNPADKDGVVTYSEANAVLPFVNNLWTLTLTGEQFKTVLEQQWQPEGNSDPYLQLGLSDNVTYTYDADAPRGEHITSVTVNGEPLDPAAEYRIGTFSFLAQGGDNFAEFTNATDVQDSGLIDREGWISYLNESFGADGGLGGGDDQPISPDFARQSVQAENLPSDVTAGQNVSFTLSELDLTSLGSPENTSVDVALEDVDGATTDLGTFDVTDGTAKIDASVPDVPEGAYTVVATANPSGTTVRVPVTVSENKADSSISAHATPGVEGRHGPLVLARVRSDGPRPTGTVQVLVGDTVLDEATVHRHGVTLLRVPRKALDAGTHRLTVRYLGSDELSGSETTVRVRVIAHRWHHGTGHGHHGKH
ncbi:MAG: 5'-nucleotidase C-terminal domain-containing protein, partial [Nocardioidaceae bacterium]